MLSILMAMATDKQQRREDEQRQRTEDAILERLDDDLETGEGGIHHLDHRQAAEMVGGRPMGETGIRPDRTPDAHGRAARAGG